MDNNTHFYNNINKFVDQVSSYEMLVKSMSIDGDENKLDQLHAAQAQLHSSLEDVQWTVSVLDQEEHQQILLLAFQALATLGTSFATLHLSTAKLSQSNDPAIKEKCGREIAVLQKLLDEPFDKAMETTAKKVNLSLGEGFLPLQKDLTENSGIDIQAADLTLASRPKLQGHSSGVYSGVFNNFVFSPGKFYNIIPKPVSHYIFSKSCNDEGRIIDILSLMLGHRLDTELKPFENNDKQIIFDRHNDTVLAPQQFTMDILRSNQFRLNGEQLYQRLDSEGNQYLGNPNDIARSLYGRFGREGGNRIMQLCNQAIMPHVMVNQHFSLMENSAFTRGIPTDAFVLPLPVNHSGFHFEVNTDNDFAKIEIKLLMRLNAVEETSYSAHFVHKTIITVPMASLTHATLEQENPNELGIQVEDVTSQLILNNENEARELLNKF